MCSLSQKQETGKPAATQTSVQVTSGPTSAQNQLSIPLSACPHSLLELSFSYRHFSKWLVTINPMRVTYTPEGQRDCQVFVFFTNWVC